MRTPRGVGKKTEHLRLVIARLYREGASLRQVGAELGCTHPAILYHLKVMGIPRRRAGYHRRT